MSKRTKTSVKRACDVLWANLVKVRANGFCERCGLSGRLEAHHIFGRGFLRLRWESRNGVALCHSCHRFAESYATEFTEWIELSSRRDDLPFLRDEFRKGLIAPRTLNDYLDLEAGLKAQIGDELGMAA